MKSQRGKFTCTHCHHQHQQPASHRDPDSRASLPKQPDSSKQHGKEKTCMFIDQSMLTRI